MSVLTPERLPSTWPLNYSRPQSGDSERGSSTKPSALPDTFPAPHAAQQKIIDSAARFRVVNFGRQAGKTTLGKRLAAEGALHGQAVAYIVPIYRTLSQVFIDLKEALSPYVVGATADERINLSTGGYIEFWSLHNGADRARGRIYNLDIFDECAMVPGIQGMWEAVWRPTLARHRGRALFFSTPRRGGGFQKLYEMGQSGDPDWESWTIDTSANPFILPEEIEAMRAGMSKQRFAQEVMADFEAAESELIFPQFRTKASGSHKAHVQAASCSWSECKWRVIGIDPGGGDPTAIYAIGVSQDERVHVYAPEFYKRGGVDALEMSDWIGRFNTVGKVQRVLVGETSGETIVATLRRLGWPAVKSELKPEEGRENIKWLLDNDVLTVDPKCEEMITEFGLYRYRIKSDPFEGDTYLTSMAGDRHGDAMDALRYGVSTVIQSLRAARPAVIEQQQRAARVQ